MISTKADNMGENADLSCLLTFFAMLFMQL